MTTTIDTNPAVSEIVTDTNAAANTITVTDGPAENGFQTTQVVSNGNTTIFANKTSLVIAAGSNNFGSNAVLDNPDPAAGLQGLAIAVTGTINGSNPNAGSPDVAAGDIILHAGGGIGTNRALRTQASILDAQAGSLVAGNFNIANGVTAPVTLTITQLLADSQAGETITLTNNGTINDTAGGIAATGAVNITANGATADFNTGSGAIIESTTGSVTLMVGRDINLGDSSGEGTVAASTGINVLAGGNITLNANAIIETVTSGNISLTAGGNFTMLASPATGGVANAPAVADGASGGTISIFTGSGKTMTLDSTGATAVESTNGAIFLAADAIVINKAVSAGTARIDLGVATAGQAISLGTANTPGTLGLTMAELDLLDGGVVQIGNTVAGNITIASQIADLTGSNTLTLENNGNISEGAFGSLIEPNLRIVSAGSVLLGNTGNDISTLAAAVSNGLTFNNGTNALTVGTVDGQQGIFASNSAISLTADAMTITQAINAGTGIVTLAPFTASQTVNIGVGNSAGVLGFTDAGLGQVTASALRIDDPTNSIDIAGAVTRHAGFNTLSLSTFGGVFQTVALSVANLAVRNGNNTTLTTAG